MRAHFPVFFLALTILFLPLAAYAASYTIGTASCSGVLELVANEPGPVVYNHHFTDCGQPSLWSDVSAHAGPGRLGAYAHGVDQYMPSDQIYSGSGQISATMQFGDVIFEGPVGVVDVRLRLHVTATLNAISEGGFSTSAVEVEVHLFNDYLLGVASVDAGIAPEGPVDHELLDGTLTPDPSGYIIDAVIVTPPIQVPTNSTLNMFISLQAYAEAYAPQGAAETLADVGNTVEFPRTGPVFILPEGYTVNSPDAGISDNLWTSEVGVDDSSWGKWKSRY
jgi:hypothetical protein